mmetsp:Transcript_55813/g.154527  ORF Transcript_55813/g.154527 Transcript_55813/m.154527 type:complete len:275 (+) Transcript_55813:81-905(+)
MHLPYQGRSVPWRASSECTLLLQVAGKEGCIWRGVGSDLCDHMQPGPLILHIHKLVAAAVLERMHTSHGGCAGRQLPAQVRLGAAQEPRLPAWHVLDANALREVLAAEDRGRCGESLRPVGKEISVNGRKLDEVVCQAEALLRPPGLAQVAPQERVSRGLVQAEAQDLVHLACPSTNLMVSAGPICHEGQPGGQLRVLSSILRAVNHSRGQRAGHARELQFAPRHVAQREVGIHVAESAEEHLLRIAITVQCRRCTAAVVDLGDPIEKHRPRHA